MKNYKYPLQKILDLKSNEKMQAEWLLAEAIGRLQSAEHSLQELFCEKKRVIALFHEHTQEKASIRQLQMLNAYMVHVDQLIEQKNAQVRKAEQKVDEEKGHVTQRMMDEKIWEKTKEKARARYMYESNKKEQNQLDEMATMRFVHS